VGPRAGHALCDGLGLIAKKMSQVGTRNPVIELSGLGLCFPLLGSYRPVLPFFRMGPS
jgi:hypothetical protein